MLKFTLASRHMDQGTRERFFYEWSIIHVALMLTTPSAMKVFKRYVQHFNIPEATSESLLYPLSAEGWESYAEHYVESYEDVVGSVHVKDYIERVHPHNFSSHRFITSILNFDLIYQRQDSRSGGVKLIHFLKKASGVSQAEFNSHLLNVRAPKILQAVCERRLVRKYVVNSALDINPAIFKGTLFEYGSTGLYAGIEEFWLDGMEAVARLRADRESLDAFRASEADVIDAAGSISMVVVERVVFDYVTPGEMSPPPSILNPDSLEAAIDRQGYRPWELLHSFTEGR